MKEQVAETVESYEVAAWAEGRINELMGVINAATAELVAVTAKVLESGAWCGGGVRSPQHWLAWKAGLSPAHAGSVITMARRKDELPVANAAFAEGRLSEDTMKLIVARTPPERDAEVTDWAQMMTVPQLRRVLRALPRVDAPETNDEPEATDHSGGEVGFGYDEHDKWWMRVNGLPTERGALFQKALERARDVEFRARHPEAGDNASPRGVTWSDALERLALAGLEALDPAGNGGRAAAGRYQVIVHVRAGDPPSANVHLGPALSAAARRRITCDADLRWVLEDQGRPVAWSRRRRTVDPVLRTLLEERDQVCAAPWCQQTRWLEWHHLRHHEDGGETTPENLKGFCGRDHLMHHLGLFDVHGDATRADGLVFTDKFGRQIKALPEPVPPEFGPVETARTLGIDAGSWLPPTGENFDPHWFDWQQ